jgi:hypothetical protein
VSIRPFIKPLASLKLTLVCLGCAMVLIFVATLAQVDLGIYEVQNLFFKSLLLFYTVPGSGFKIPVFPGGFLIGAVLLVNLIAAHLSRFKLSWKKLGISILHGGLILLLLGQLITSLFQVESQMRLDDGESKSYSESPYDYELAVIDTSGATTDKVISVPDSDLKKGARIGLPVDGLQVVVKDFYPNSVLISPDRLPSSDYPHLRVGPMAVAVNVKKTYKQDERNMPTVDVSVLQKEQTLGSWSLAAGFPATQTFESNGKSYEIVFRAKRYYQPYTIKLLKFHHDRYAGTDIAKNFSSQIILTDAVHHRNYQTMIYMNHPLHYNGLTYYQAGYDNNDHTTVLQVMRNPSRLVPYIACGLVALGMLIQFGMHLGQFIRRRVIR